MNIRTLVLLVFLVGLFAMGYSAKPVQTPFAFPQDNLWKHRQNTSALAASALQQGFAGIELDLIFRDGELRVAHDANELRDSERLADYLATIDAGSISAHFWFDIKNLSFTNARTIREHLVSLIARFRLQNRLIVESSRPYRMIQLCQGMIKCTVWVRSGQSSLLDIWYRFSVNSLSRIMNVSSISMDYRTVRSKTGLVPENFPIVLFTFPTGFDLSSFPDKDRYSVLLTD